MSEKSDDSKRYPSKEDEYVSTVLCNSQQRAGQRESSWSFIAVTVTEVKLQDYESCGNIDKVIPNRNF